MYKNFRFVKIILTKDDKVIEGYISDSDRFNNRFLKIILQGKVEGLTQLIIDELILTPVIGDIDFSLDGRNIPQTEQYKFYAECLIDNNNETSALMVSIDNPIRFVSCGDRQYDKSNRSWQINMCEISIPYKSTIKNGMITD